MQEYRLSYCDVIVLSKDLIMRETLQQFKIQILGHMQEGMVCQFNLIVPILQVKQSEEGCTNAITIQKASISQFESFSFSSAGSFCLLLLHFFPMSIPSSACL